MTASQIKPAKEEIIRLHRQYKSDPFLKQCIEQIVYIQSLHASPRALINTDGTIGEIEWVYTDGAKESIHLIKEEMQSHTDKYYSVLFTH
jgi:hypothetical protein